MAYLPTIYISMKYLIEIENFKMMETDWTWCLMQIAEMLNMMQETRQTAIPIHAAMYDQPMWNFVFSRKSVGHVE